MVTYYSAQMPESRSGVAQAARNYPIDKHGKLRVAYFKFTNASGGTYADGSEIELCMLPQGRVRVFPNLSRYRVTALGASRVLDIGHRIYNKDGSYATEAEDDDAFVSNKDVSGAVNDVAFDGGAAAMKFDMYSLAEKIIFATVDGGTIPNGAIIEGYVVYAHE